MGGNGKVGTLASDRCGRVGDAVTMPPHIAREVLHLLRSPELDGKGEYFAELILDALKRNG